MILLLPKYFLTVSDLVMPQFINMVLNMKWKHLDRTVSDCLIYLDGTVSDCLTQELTVIINIVWLRSLLPNHIILGSIPLEEVSFSTIPYQWYGIVENDNN